MLKCQTPLCINYQEIINPYTPKTTVKIVCNKHDFDLNYHNQDKIDNCEDHKTYEQLRNDWKQYKNI